MPVALAFLLALILSPLVRMLQRRGIPEGVSAVLIVLVFASGVGSAAWSLSGPASRMIDDAPQIGFELQRKLATLGKPFKTVKKAEQSIKEATNEEPEPGVQEVVVRETGLLSRAAGGILEFVAGSSLTLVLLLFLLASGDLFYEKLVRSMPTMTDKKRWLRTVYDVEREVSRYLFTVSAINLGLGICVAIGLYLVGAPDPLLWGVAAALLNFVPYLGSLVGIAALAVVSIVTLPSFGWALLPPLIYAVCTILEGQFITPALVGRRLQINAVAVFLAIAFWGWLWGIVGVLMAVPILIVVKTFAQHADGLAGLQEFLGIRAPPPDEDTGDQHAGTKT